MSVKLNTRWKIKALYVVHIRFFFFTHHRIDRNTNSLIAHVIIHHLFLKPNISSVRVDARCRIALIPTTS